MFRGLIQEFCDDVRTVIFEGPEGQICCFAHFFTRSKNHVLNLTNDT